MSKSNKSFKTIISLVILLLFSSAVIAQKNSKKEPPKGNPVMWEQVSISEQDLFTGPGGEAMRPDLSKITLIKEEKGGSSKKYRIKDGSGKIWVAKIDSESQSETAAVRILSALGYKTEVNYLAPTITIPGKGTFQNVRLEARPETVDRGDRWKWSENAFSNTNEFQGLKIMMAFMNNWDLKDGNNIILQNGGELQFVISDLGATFGSLGSNNLPIFWRVGRSKNNPEDYKESDFIETVEDGAVEFSFKGKGNKLFDDISVENGRWLADLLVQLSDKQIEDAFRAANYSPEEIKTLSAAVKSRIAALDDATQLKTEAEIQNKK